MCNSSNDDDDDNNNNNNNNYNKEWRGVESRWILFLLFILLNDGFSLY